MNLSVKYGCNLIYRKIFHNYMSYHLRYGDENLQPKVAEVATLLLLPIYQSGLNVNIEIRCNRCLCAHYYVVTIATPHCRNIAAQQ